MTYSNRLKSIREKNNVKQSTLSKILNINENAYSQYETEYVIIPIKHLQLFQSFC